MCVLFFLKHILWKLEYIAVLNESSQVLGVTRLVKCFGQTRFKCKEFELGRFFSLCTVPAVEVCLLGLILVVGNPFNPLKQTAKKYDLIQVQLLVCGVCGYNLTKGYCKCDVLCQTRVFLFNTTLHF